MLVAEDTVDADLAAMVWLLATHGLPVVVVGRDRALGEELRAALAATVRSEQPARDAIPGGVFLGRSLEDIVRVTGGAGSAAGHGAVPDEVRDLGVVLVLDDAGAVAVAHYVRPVERDGAGHVQRRPPAVLSARDGVSGTLDHFWWAFTDELATRCGIERADFEAEHAARARQLSDADWVPGALDARH
jgi:hypothetical protein